MANFSAVVNGSLTFCDAVTTVTHRERRGQKRIGQKDQQQGGAVNVLCLCLMVLCVSVCVCLWLTWLKCVMVFGFKYFSALS